MIFVTVGTTDFDALVREMDRLAPGLGEPVTFQTGRGGARPLHAAESFAFAPALEPDYPPGGRGGGRARGSPAGVDAATLARLAGTRNGGPKTDPGAGVSAPRR